MALKKSSKKAKMAWNSHLWKHYQTVTRNEEKEGADRVAVQGWQVVKTIVGKIARLFWILKFFSE